MSRSPILIALATFAVALLAVPAALASGGHHRSIRITGTCTQGSTSKLKLSREGRRIEVEFEVDQNRNGVPWRVTLSRNGHAVASLRATTHAPSGSFEVRRIVSGRLGVSRITAVARHGSGETCTARSSSRSATTASAARADDNGNDAGDDRGHDSGRHS